jgi:hypothetical protein
MNGICQASGQFDTELYAMTVVEYSQPQEVRQNVINPTHFI